MKRSLPVLALLLILALVAWWAQARRLPSRGFEAIGPAVSSEKSELEVSMEPLSEVPREPVAETIAPGDAGDAEDAGADDPSASASPDLVFHARAVDAITRVGVASARVKWNSAEALTDRDGRFRFHGEDWTSEAMQLDAAGYSRAWILPAKGHETAETAFEIVLSKCATLRLHLLEASGQPIVGASVTALVARYTILQPEELVLSNSTIYQDDSFDARTDGTGTAVLSNLPARAGVKLSASAARRRLRSESEELVLQPGEERELTWRIGAGSRVFGTVTEADGQPAQSQEIWLQPARMVGPRFLERFEQEGRRQTRCNARGEFEFTDVTPGGWLLGPADARETNGAWKDGLVAAWAEHIDVVAELQELRHDIVLTRDLAIRGRVLDSRGHPVATDVEARHAASTFPKRTKSGDDGTFVMGPLIPGDYRLTAGGWADLGGAPQTASPEVRAAAGSNDVVLQLQAGCSISGRVVDASTGEVLQAQLTLTPDPGQSEIRFTTQMTTSNPAGEYSMRGLHPGVYSLTAATLTGRIGTLRSFRLAAGTERVGLELRVAPGATVGIFYDGSTPNAAIRLFTGDVAIASDGIQKGTRRSFTVPAGRNVARMSCPPDWTNFEIAFDVGVGETKELSFDGAWK